jgi:hypothetical protein
MVPTIAASRPTVVISPEFCVFYSTSISHPACLSVSLTCTVQLEIGAHDSIIFSTPHFLALPLSRAARVFSNTNILGELGGR